jgi:N-acetylglucosamine malate deacetylase 1
MCGSRRLLDRLGMRFTCLTLIAATSLMIPLVSRAWSLERDDARQVIIIVAHPDEAEEYAGGAAALLAQAGHRVKFLCTTNGDVGHWQMSKKALARRRHQEALEAGKILGIAAYEIFDYHDGELDNTSALRKKIVTSIREWRADLVISIMPMFGGGHLDEMTTGQAVQQSAGLCSAPLFLPKIPALKKRPLFLYMRCYYSNRFPHQPDLVIPIDAVVEKKLLSWNAHASQFYEFAPWQKGILNEVPDDWTERRNFLIKHYEEDLFISQQMREWLVRWYGAERGHSFQFAEEFELPHFSRKPEEGEWRLFFPILESN